MTVPEYPGATHKTSGARDPASAFSLAVTRDDAQERRVANRAIAVSAMGLGATGSSSCCWRCSPTRLGCSATRSTTCRTSPPARWSSWVSGYPGARRPNATPTAWSELRTWRGFGIAVVIWASAAFAGYESVRKLVADDALGPRQLRGGEAAARHVDFARDLYEPGSQARRVRSNGPGAVSSTLPGPGTAYRLAYGNDLVRVKTAGHLTHLDVQCPAGPCHTADLG